jgi:hypothetical protein
MLRRIFGEVLDVAGQLLVQKRHGVGAADFEYAEVAQRRDDGRRTRCGEFRSGIAKIGDHALCRACTGGAKKFQPARTHCRFIFIRWFSEVWTRRIPRQSGFHEGPAGRQL